MAKVMHLVYTLLTCTCMKDRQEIHIDNLTCLLKGVQHPHDRNVWWGRSTWNIQHSGSIRLLPTWIKWGKEEEGRVDLDPLPLRVEWRGMDCWEIKEEGSECGRRGGWCLCVCLSSHTVEINLTSALWNKQREMLPGWLWTQTHWSTESIKHQCSRDSSPINENCHHLLARSKLSLYWRCS